MKRKIESKEILDIIKKTPAHTIKLADLYHEINKNREEPVGKTTVYDNAQKLVEEGLIEHNPDFGYFLNNPWQDGKKLIQKYLKMFQDLQYMNISIHESGNDEIDIVQDQTSIESVPENLKIMFKSFCNEYSKLKKLSLVKTLPDKENKIILSYLSAWLLNICPICLSKINTKHSYFNILFKNNKTDELEHFTKAHIKCGQKIIDRETVNGKITTTSRLFSKTENTSFSKANLIFKIPDVCAKCGLPLSIPDVFQNFFSDVKESALTNSNSSLYELSRELYGDINTLYWKFQWEIEMDYEEYLLEFQKVLEQNNEYYHPNCLKNK